MVRKKSRQRSNKKTKSRTNSRKSSRKTSLRAKRKTSESKLRAERKTSKTNLRKKRDSNSSTKKKRSTKVHANLCIPAGARMMDHKSRMVRPHLFLIAIKSNDFAVQNAILKDSKIYLEYNLRPNSDGKYTATYSRIKKPKADKKTIVVEGAIEILNRKLHAHLLEKYGGDIIANYNPPHVLLRSLKLKQIELYSSFTINEISLKCE